MERIVAIVTVYYPQEEHVRNIKLISNQVDLVIVNDNSPQANYGMFTDSENIKYIFWGKNLGLSASFNKILRDEIFLWNESDYIIFFDQDTIIPVDHINKLIKDYCLLEKMGYSIGCIGPVFFNRSIGKTEIPTLNKRITNSIMRVNGIITSSMLCKYTNIKKISFWNEELFLDMADWDLCWRFISSKMFCFMSNNSVIDHCVGEGKKQVLFFNLRIAKPFREYYQIRDCLYLLHKKYVPWNFRIRFIIRLLIRPFLHIIFLDQPKKRAEYIFLGIKDYFLNKHGEVKSL